MCEDDKLLLKMAARMKEVTSDQEVAQMFVVNLSKHQKELPEPDDGYLETSGQNHVMDINDNTEEIQIDSKLSRSRILPEYHSPDIVTSSPNDPEETQVLSREPVSPLGPKPNTSGTTLDMSKLSTVPIPQARNHGIVLDQNSSQTINSNGEYSCQTSPSSLTMKDHKCLTDTTTTASTIPACMICKTSFPTMDGLKTHMESHWKDLPYHCESCSARFFTAHSLNLHKTRSTCAKKVDCTICKRSFGSRRNLIIHYNAKHKELCPIDSSLNITVPDAKLFVSDVNDEEMPDALDLSKSNTSRSVINFKCILCQEKGFESEQALGEHVLRNHTNFAVMLPTVKPEAVLGEAKPGFTCKQCSLSFISNEHLIQHIDSTHAKMVKYYGCTQCEKRYLRNSDLRRHVRKKHDSVDLNSVRILHTMDDTQLVSQQREVTSIVMDKSTIPQSPPLVSPVMNPVSPKSTTSSGASIPSPNASPGGEINMAGSSLLSNLAKKAKTLMHKKAIDAQLKEISELPKNQHELVTKVKPVKSYKPIKPKPGEQKGIDLPLTSLISHKSGKAMAFNCSNCGKGFANAVTFALHVESKIKCDHCKVACCTKDDLQSHIAKNHPHIALTTPGESEVQSFKCAVCRFQFSCQANLDAHMPVHIEKRPNKCPLCSRRFTTEPYMERHLMRDHKNNQEFLKTYQFSGIPRRNSLDY